MSECHHCNTENQTIKVDGRSVELCLHVGCIMDRMMAQYENCSHSLKTVGEGLLECSNCGMNATPSYQ